MTRITTLETLAVRVNELEKHSNNEIDHLREIIANSAQATERALQLQASEYERRLASLNHEAQRIALIQAEYVPKGEYKLQMDALQLSVIGLEKHRANLDGRVLGFGFAVGAVVTLINIALQFLP